MKGTAMHNTTQPSAERGSCLLRRACTLLLADDRTNRAVTRKDNRFYPAWMGLDDVTESTVFAIVISPIQPTGHGGFFLFFNYGFDVEE